MSPDLLNLNSCVIGQQCAFKMYYYSGIDTRLTLNDILMYVRPLLYSKVI